MVLSEQNRRLTLLNLWTSQKFWYYGLMMYEGREKGGSFLSQPSLPVPNIEQIQPHKSLNSKLNRDIFWEQSAKLKSESAMDHFTETESANV